LLVEYRNIITAKRIYNEVASALQIHRKEIEKVIGDFDIPKFRDIVWFTSKVKNQNGTTRQAMNCAFGFEVLSCSFLRHTTNHLNFDFKLLQIF
jgi:hypothetical protein